MVKEIRKLHEGGRKYGDIALLYRAHFVTRNLEEALLKSEIPYTIYSGTQFFDRMEIKDALSYLRMIVYKDDMAFRRIVNHPQLKDKPMILETPNELPGYAKEIALLKELTTF